MVYSQLGEPVPAHCSKTAVKTGAAWKLYLIEEDETMKKVGPVTLAVLSLAWSVLAQEQPLKVKGGHELGETAEQFFAEGQEKMALSACAARDFKSVDRSNRRLAKKICSDLVDARQQAMSGKRSEYQSGGDPAEVRMDTFTFDGDHLER